VTAADAGTEGGSEDQPGDGHGGGPGDAPVPDRGPAGPVPASVRAAGGVVWRRAPDGDPTEAGIEVLIVHRPHRQDWSFPKGKADPWEDDDTCARREVAEETGLRCRLGADLGRVGYVDAKGRPKTVHWWAMSVEGGGAGPDSPDEVDELRWLGPEEAAAQLSYDNDRIVLDRFRRAMSTAAP
jgi:8-oxo-dGTP pyrophosphatase MutT (NUDIX family)